MSVPSITFDADFSSGNIGSATISAAGALPVTPLLRLPMARASLVNAAGIAYTVNVDGSGAVSSYSAALSVTPSSLTSSFVTTAVSGATNNWSNGNAGNGNMIDVSFSFKTKTTRLRFDTLSASTLVGANTVGHHVAFMVTHAMGVHKPTSVTDVFSAAQVTAMATAINTQVANKVYGVLSDQGTLQAILDGLVAANGPILDPSGSRVLYDASLTGMNIVMNLKNFKITINLPYASNPTAELTFVAVPVVVNIV